MPPLTRLTPRRWPIAAAFALGLIAIAFRLAFLDRVPGINADEAQYACQIRAWLAGAPHSWYTPTQRLISPFFLAMQIPVQALFAPTAWALRLPGALFDAAVVALAFFTLPRVFRSRSLGLALAVLIACMPGYITGARDAIELDQIAAASLAATIFTWQRRPVLALLSLAAAILIHKVTIFLTPLVVLPLAYDWLRDWPKLSARAKTLKAGALVALTVGVLAWVASQPVPAEYGNLVTAAWQRLTGFEELGPFLAHLCSFVLGPNFFQEFASPLPRALLLSLHAIGILGNGLLLFFGLRQLRRRLKKNPDYAEAKQILAWVIGWVASGVSIYLIAGKYGIAGGHTLYLLGLGVPTLFVTLLLAREAVGAALGPDATRARVEARLLKITVIFAGILLLLTSKYYFYPQLQARPGIMRMYASNPEEPKVAAYQWIREDFTSPDHAPIVIADDWWIYWVLKYLDSAHAHPFEMYHHDTVLPNGLTQDNFVNSTTQLRPLVEAGGYVVCFAGGPLEHLLYLTYNSFLTLERHDVFLGLRKQRFISIYRKIAP